MEKLFKLCYRTYSSVYNRKQRKKLNQFGNSWFSPFSEIKNPHLIAVGDNTTVGPNCILWAVEQSQKDHSVKIVIGNNVLLFRNTTIVAMKKIIIGDYCMLAENVSIRDQDHEFSDNSKPIRSQGFTIDPVILEDNVWVGAGTIILRGVRIGRGSIIGANSVVNRSVAQYSIVAGVPAKVIKRRDLYKRDLYEELANNCLD